MSAIWPSGTNIKWGREDQGIDGTVTPGTPALAVGSGTVQINHDPNGFGANYAILHLDTPLQTPCGPQSAVYYGHLFPSVPDGAHVDEGQAVAAAGQQGGGNASGETGGFELGFFGPGGPTGGGACASGFFGGPASGTLLASSSGSSSNPLAALAAALSNLGKFFDALTNVTTWRNLGELAAGLALVLVGAVVLKDAVAPKESGGGILSTVEKVAPLAELAAA